MNRPRPTTAIRLIIFFQAILLVSCFGYRKDRMEETVRPEAYVPVYGYDSVLRSVKSIAPQPTENAGKIYVYGQYLFQVEQMKGVHVIDFSDKSKPVKIGFIVSKGCSEVAVKNGYLVTNNCDDLVTIDMQQLNNVKEAGRIHNAFTHYEYHLLFFTPPEAGKYYVCPEPDKGDIIGWKLEKNVKNAGCFN